MKALVSLSGGMDSATVLALAVKEGRDVSCVCFSYGSKHGPYEVIAARTIASHYNVPYRLHDLTLAMYGIKSDLLLTGGDVPEGHYEEESMRRTVVPGRNLIFASILAGLAASEGAEEIWLGAHAGDHHIYPDCRPEFIRSLSETIRLAVDKDIQLCVPYMHATKAGILKKGLEMSVPYVLTRTCYRNQAKACGRCGSCQERLASYVELGIIDPLEYETREIMPKGK